jgi:diacylglycerol kinase family enzyme
MRSDPSVHNRAPWRVLVNPTSGAGRGGRAATALTRELVARGVPFARIDTTHRGHARSLAAATPPGTPVLVVGGDGTVHEVVAGLPVHDRQLGPLAILPCGSGDDFARSVGSDGDVARLVQALAGSPRLVDVGLATLGTGTTAVRERFANAAGLGFDAEVAAQACRPHRLRGRLHYARSTFAVLRRPHRLTATITLDTGTGPQRLPTRDFAFVATCNGQYFGGGLHLVPHGRCDDGRLDAVAVDAVGPLGLLWLLAKLCCGRHCRDRRVRLDAVTRLTIELAAPTACAFDGEPWPERVQRIHYELAPERLRLLGTTAR